MLEPGRVQSHLVPLLLRVSEVHKVAVGELEKAGVVRKAVPATVVVEEKEDEFSLFLPFDADEVAEDERDDGEDWREEMRREDLLEQFYGSDESSVSSLSSPTSCCEGCFVFCVLIVVLFANFVCWLNFSNVYSFIFFIEKASTMTAAVIIQLLKRCRFDFYLFICLFVSSFICLFYFYFFQNNYWQWMVLDSLNHLEKYSQKKWDFQTLR
jgi:hypothetical protein